MRLFQMSASLLLVACALGNAFGQQSIILPGSHGPVVASSGVTYINGRPARLCSCGKHYVYIRQSSSPLIVTTNTSEACALCLCGK